MQCSTAKRNRVRAFALLDLLFVVVILAALAAVFSSFPERLRERTHITIDLNNLRQILHGSALYSNENNDHLAHPTWGGDLTGPDGWAYLISQRSREVPGALFPYNGGCANVDTDSPQFTNQLAYFRAGQVGQYLLDVKKTWCPKDVATRGMGSAAGSLRRLWLGRPVKVTSYLWNGSISGYGGARVGDLGGKTYKTSQFLPTDWQMWEGNDADSFSFNDAAVDPEDTRGFSRRHSGQRVWWNFFATSPRNLPGVAVVGTFGGGARTFRWPKVWDLMNRPGQIPNEVRNGPDNTY
jgi:hypothetical protein